MFDRVFSAMLDMLQDLVRHKWHANAAILQAVRQHDAATHDEESRKLLHHILQANRYWLLLTLQKEFDRESESRVPDTLDSLIARYRETAILELDWLFQLPEADLVRQLRTPFLPTRSFSIAEAVMQICMHSHGHRAQCAVRLRALGGTPPMMDYVVWLVQKPDPEWPQRS
jgi:uncharacterized damage-inducible protein DinB